MKIYHPQDFKRLEQEYCASAGITMAELMERAIEGFTAKALKLIGSHTRRILVLAGPGNNGGDAVGIAARLFNQGHDLTLVGILHENKSELLQAQLDKLPSDLKKLFWKRDVKKIQEWQGEYIVDGIFGYGLNRPLQGEIMTFVKWINSLPTTRIAIDVPSGLYASMEESPYALQADSTITFHSPKPSFFLEENHKYIGAWEQVDVGIKEEGFLPLLPYYNYYTQIDAKAALPQKQQNDHKGTNGHNLLISGQKGMMGCTTLSARACLKSGAGKLTVHAPRIAHDILQITIPEAMTSSDPCNEYITEVPGLSEYNIIGIGPGIGTRSETSDALRKLLNIRNVPLVLDADALNILSQWPDWKELLGKNDVILPHPGEFDRLFGEHNSRLDRLETIKKTIEIYPFTIVLKGPYSIVANNQKGISFNSTGNPGMATGGTGDVLTGMTMSLIGQGMATYDASCLAVYMHGKAGDLYIEKEDPLSLIASNIIENIGTAIYKTRSS